MLLLLCMNNIHYSLFFFFSEHHQFYPTIQLSKHRSACGCGDICQVSFLVWRMFFKGVNWNGIRLTFNRACIDLPSISWLLTTEKETLKLKKIILYLGGKKSEESDWSGKDKLKIWKGGNPEYNLRVEFTDLRPFSKFIKNEKSKCQWVD